MHFVSKVFVSQKDITVLAANQEKKKNTFLKLQEPLNVLTVKLEKQVHT